MLRFVGLRRGPVAYMPVLLALFVLLAGCGEGTPAPKPAPSTNSNQPVTFDLGIPKEAMNAPVVGDVANDTILHVIVSFKLNENTLNSLGANDQASNNQDINVQDKANELGISDQTYEKIKTYFGIQDAKLTLNKMHTNLSVDVKAGSIAHLLNTKLVYRQYEGRKFFTPEKEIKLPKFVVDNIVSVTGLDSYSLPPQHHAQQLTRTTTSTAVKNGADCNADPASVQPSGVQNSYHLDQLYKQKYTGKGTTVILPEFSAYDPNDIQNYFDCVGYSGHFSTVDVGDAPTQATGEETLDIDMIAGIAPAADIQIYQSSLDNVQTFGDFWSTFHAVMQQIIEDNQNNKSPKVLSLSWGYGERSLTTSVMQMLDNDIQVLTRTEHITLFVASGDCGAYDLGTYKRLDVDFFAADPWAVSVGGTVLTVDDKGNRRSEVVWSGEVKDPKECKNSWGSGGGVSTIFAKPQWQGNSVQNKYSNGKRQIPDVAAVAFNVPVYYQGQWYTFGGTSAAAPIWAAGFAIVNQALVAKTGYFVYGPKVLYATVANAGKYHPFYDIQSGNNLYYPATQGWDYSTGFGTPNFYDIFQVLNGLITKK